MPMTRMGSLLQVHPTSVTSAVDRLEKQGYVARSRQDSDRRVVLATITPSGRAVVEQATAGLNSSVFESPGLSSSELADLTRLLGAACARVPATTWTEPLRPTARDSPVTFRTVWIVPIGAERQGLSRPAPSGVRLLGRPTIRRTPLRTRP